MAMKTKTVQIINTLIIIIFLSGSNITYSKAQDKPNYITIEGVVKDKQNKKKLEYVNISVPGTNVGVVTNINGEFSLKIQDSLQVEEVEFSHIGYFNHKLPVNNQNLLDIEVLLTPNSKVLDEIVVYTNNPRQLVEAAINKIESNYSSSPMLLTGFYRETVQKGKRYIDISEAIVNVYKTAYDKDIYQDKAQILKGRRLLSPKISDTLAVKLLGGPNLAIFADIVKNSDFILNLETLSYYQFKMENPVNIDEQPHFVISFKPQVIIPYALYKGRLYINQSNMAISQVEVNLDMDDKNKATQFILWKKPSKLRFNPEENSFFITYKQRGNRTYLSYIRNTIKFKSDWKRKLFPTGYTVVSEMVVTDIKEQKKSGIPSKMVFGKDKALSDKVSSFYDPDFWEDYNIIEPTESLQSAVGKLKKQYQD